MKKIYKEPVLTVVTLQVENHLMNLSDGGSASISSNEADGDGFTKESGNWDIWDE